jgi:serine/threonine protein kinase/Tol biopolymer transport system component
MGEVYRARDTRLPRSVAIKVLPADFATDPRLRARFEQEAKTISALNHPHICTLLDVGRENGVEYLVMEYCEGQTLADRIERGALPLDQLLQYGADLGDALSRAHRAGIVHRDLKPSNVMVTQSGVKLLDFGLARMHIESSPVESTARLTTAAGTILGTIQYMAPEVLAGKEADARSDIFAFGLILYEMVTGKPAFSGSNKASVMASILEREPQPIHEPRPDTPPALEHVINKCISKQPDERWESAHDVAEQLRFIRENKPASVVAGRRTTMAVAIVAAATFIAIAAIWKLSSHEQRNSVVRLSIPLAQTGNEAAGNEASPVSIGASSGRPSVAISPDGKRIAYAAERNGVSHIYLRQLDSFETIVLEGPGGGPFFSPDGQWIGFTRLGSLMKAPVAGGVARPLSIALLGVGRGATWAPDGTIYFCPSSAAGLWKISSNGGAAQKVTEPDIAGGENSHRWPQILPDGKHLLFTIRTDAITSFDDARIAVLSLDTGTWKVVLEGGAYARYVSGTLLFGRAGNLYAVPFDLRSFTVTGPRRKVIDGVLTMPSSGAAHFDVSSSGDLVYIPGGIAYGRTAILSVDAMGHTKPVANLAQSAGEIKRSPDGRRIALGVSAANDNIWLYDVGSGAATRFTFERGEEGSPVWTPDGSRLLYGAGPPVRTMIRNADGAGDSEVLVQSGPPLSCSSDGKLLLYRDKTPATGFDIWLQPLTGDRKPRSLLRTQFNETEASFSPDGRWVTYTSDETGHFEAYVCASAGGGGHWQISVDGAHSPRWSSDGKAVYYRQGDNFFTVPISMNGNDVQPAKRELLFTIPAVSGYDVINGGFLVAQNIEDFHGTRQLNVILNWKRELTP